MKLLGILVSAFAVAAVLAAQTPERPYDITVRDDKDPWMASFQSKTGAYAVDACDEYGFGSGRGAKIETLGCTTIITFDFKWRGDKDFSFHPRHHCDDTIRIKTGDVLHGVFTVDTCAKTATGTIRDETQTFDLMNVVDTNIADSEGYCAGPPPCR
jgi:hypothetical protein